ncbi:zinc dependent phospholipase C family protein [Paenibacillus ginsengarvi]|uniref:Hydrolase n=1 Tax=Paenibacillus ginsengarvi TaxID=400777 RepID=A0A3B0CF45_9BACL|nr:zinc dependent phospholipase C family protein [Paenibacillus ginsengarvi]RKN84092.1 hydrolase [Paenibacillus ginsengarvi]
MGSRIMHFIIAEQTARKLSGGSSPEFLLGGIAPDARQPKDITHFYLKDEQQITRHIGYMPFMQKYSSFIEAKDEYILGYLCHLIADDIWLRAFYLPWLRKLIEENPGQYEKYHRDFRNLNGKLLQWSQIGDHKQKLEGPVRGTDIEELPFDEVLRFIPAFLEDFEYTNDAIDCELQVFTMEQITEYIETSVQMSVSILGQILYAVK